MYSTVVTTRTLLRSGSPGAASSMEKRPWLALLILPTWLPESRANCSAAFRAFYCPYELPETNTYKSVFKEYVQGEEDPIVEFPTDLFVPDSDIPDDLTGVKPIIRIIENDGTSLHFDLQGRPLPGKPEKGVYIYKGKKAAQ